MPNYVRSRRLKNEGWPIYWKLTGDLPHGRGLSPLKMASAYHHPSRNSTGVSKCAKSCQELLAEKWWLADLLKTHRGPAPWWEQHPLKTAGPYLKPPWSSAGQSKCAKSHQEQLAEKWSLADLLETPMGPIPWWGLPPLKTASPYHHPLRSSTGMSKCAKSHPEPLGEGFLPWRSQVPTTILLGAAQVQVNVPNYIWSCRLCTTLVNLGELGAAWNSQGTCPWPRITFPEDGKSLALSSEEQARHE